jgi:hypothetical protein
VYYGKKNDIEKSAYCGSINEIKKIPGSLQGCQIFLGATIPKPDKIYQKDHKVFKTITGYTSVARWFVF